MKLRGSGVIALVAGGACVAAAGVAALLIFPAGFPVSHAGLGQAVSLGRASGSDMRATGSGSPGTPQAIDRALFSPGACLAFPPTGGDQHKTVFLDAGHGGIDPGAVGTTESGASVTESTVNLAIELDALAGLRARGYRVVVSRTENTTVTRLTPGDTDGGLLTSEGVHNDVAARAVCANMAKANVLVGIYMDSGEPWNAGCVTGYDQDRAFSAGNLRLASLVQGDVLGAMNAQGWGIPNEGVQPDTGLGSASDAAAENYGHLMLLGPAEAGYFETPSQMPGALIEPLFLTDPFEASIAASAHGQQMIAQALTKAIGQYLAGS
ncbi:MAG TPA: N-acetylmuramoyl-L-alanine amidase [Trebonia sp.]|nr:N-acetylmuramoyl-L-alanine amidase [Trebonia sp.]